MRYVSLIHRDDAGYGVSFPDFPGCVTVGDTVDDAVRLGSEALAFHVEGLLDDGEPIPPPRSIDATVPRGMSLFGCGTVTRPGLAGCVNCQWLPLVATCTQPSCRSIRMSLPLLRSTTYFGHRVRPTDRNLGSRRP